MGAETDPNNFKTNEIIGGGPMQNESEGFLDKK
jgi:hypothetical protein